MSITTCLLAPAANNFVFIDTVLFALIHLYPDYLNDNKKKSAFHSFKAVSA